MKFFIAFVALVAVSAAASFHKPASNFDEELQAIRDAINSPSTDPATAILLEQQLEAILASIKPEPIIVDPVIVDPVIVDEAPQEVPVAAESSPLVKIIINVNSGSAVPSPSPSPVIVVPGPEPIETEPVIIAPIVPPQPEPIVPEPVIIAPIIPPQPEPIVPEPVIIAPIIPPQPEPIEPEPVLLPGILN